MLTLALSLLFHEFVSSSTRCQFYLSVFLFILWEFFSDVFLRSFSQIRFSSTSWRFLLRNFSQIRFFFNWLLFYLLESPAEWGGFETPLGEYCNGVRDARFPASRLRKGEHLRILWRNLEISLEQAFR